MPLGDRSPRSTNVIVLMALAALGVVTAWLGGCADRVVDLRYASDPKIDQIADAVCFLRYEFGKRPVFGRCASCASMALNRGSPGALAFR